MLEISHQRDERIRGSRWSTRYFISFCCQNVKISRPSFVFERIFRTGKCVGDSEFSREQEEEEKGGGGRFSFSIRLGFIYFGSFSKNNTGRISRTWGIVSNYLTGTALETPGIPPNLPPPSECHLRPVNETKPKKLYSLILLVLLETHPFTPHFPSKTRFVSKLLNHN